jgi:hypothetical protein
VTLAYGGGLVAFASPEFGIVIKYVNESAFAVLTDARAEIERTARISANLRRFIVPGIHYLKKGRKKLRLISAERCGASAGSSGFQPRSLDGFESSMWIGTPWSEQIVGQSLGAEPVNVIGPFPGLVAGVYSIPRGIILEFRLQF